MTDLFTGDLLTTRKAPWREYEAPFGEAVGASAGDALDYNPAGYLYGWSRDAIADWQSRSGFSFFGGTEERVSRAQALDEAAKRGVTVDVPEDGMARTTLDAMIGLRERERARRDVFERQSQDTGTLTAQFLAGAAAGAVDPVNVASAFIPIVSQARYLKALAGATGFFGRTAVRAGVGFVEGAAGALMLEPLVFAGAKSYGQQYDLTDSFVNIVGGGLLGGALHAGGGAIGELVGRNVPSAGAGDLADDAAIAAGRTGEGPLSVERSGERAMPVTPADLGAAVKALEEGRAVDIGARDSVPRLARDVFPSITQEAYAAGLDTVMLARMPDNPAGDLISDIRRLGGIAVRDESGAVTREGGDVLAVLKDTQFPGLINNKSGRSPDYIREALAERGWFGTREDSGEDIQALYDLLDRRARGEIVAKPDDAAAISERQAMVKAAREEMAAAGVKEGERRERAAGKVAGYRARRARDAEIAQGISQARANPGASDARLLRMAREEPVEREPGEDLDVDGGTGTASEAELVQADSDYLRARIASLEAQDLWDAADRALIAEADKVAAQYKSAAQVYRAAGVCMAG